MQKRSGFSCLMSNSGAYYQYDECTDTLAAATTQVPSDWQSFMYSATLTCNFTDGSQLVAGTWPNLNPNENLNLEQWPKLMLWLWWLLTSRVVHLLSTSLLCAQTAWWTWNPATLPDALISTVCPPASAVTSPPATSINRFRVYKPLALLHLHLPVRLFKARSKFSFNQFRIRWAYERS